MKALIYALSMGAAALLSAQEVVLPEPTEPPFEVGALPLESGYTVQRENAPDLNFRIVGNKLRLYWLDDDGLIVEPDVSVASVRFTGSVRGRSFLQLTRLSGDTGFGSSYNLLKPHIYNVFLSVGSPDSEELSTYRFRYTPSMDDVQAPDAQI